MECRDPQPSFPLPAVSPVIRRVGSRQGEGWYRTLRAAASQLLKLPAPPPPPSDHGIPVGDLRPSGGNIAGVGQKEEVQGDRRLCLHV